MSSGRNHIVLISAIIALGGFLMGFDASVISGVVKFIEPEFRLTKIELGWAVSSLTLASTLAMLVAGPVSDKLGRKFTLKIAAVLYALSAIGSAVAPTFTLLVIARMVGGLGVGASLIVAPMYIAEISPPKKRGAMVSFNQLNIVIGISVAFFSNYLILRAGQSGASWVQILGIDFNAWRWMLGLEALPAFLYFFALFIVPESPRWLIMKRRDNEALNILVKVDEKGGMLEFQSLKSSIGKNGEKPNVGFQAIFQPALTAVLTIGIVLAILQQATGINSVFFYAPMIFEQTGLGVDASFSQAIFVGLTNLVFTIIAMVLIDKIGRKKLLIVGVSGIVLAMFTLTFGFNSATFKIDRNTLESVENIDVRQKLIPLENQVYRSETEFKSALHAILGNPLDQELEATLIKSAISLNSGLILAAILFFVASFAVSLGPVMWVLFSELFPNSLRAMAISFVGFINSMVSFSVQLVFPWELANFGSATTFMIYGIIAVLGLVFVFTKVPETRGKTLEELQGILVKGLKLT